jgi:type II secretory pathway predicted ATPase ExeA
MTAQHPDPKKQRLRAHFRFSKVPFSKYAHAANMFNSRGQKALHEALVMWTDLQGIALVTGPPGVGKSISLRRFALELDDNRFYTTAFGYVPTTPNGFLRSLSRRLGLPMRQSTADLFDSVQGYLMAYQAERGPHPLLIIDDAEGLPTDVFDLLRRLTCYELDARDRFSVLIAGTEDVLTTLQAPELTSLRSRVSYAHSLRPFGIEDARDYVKHHLLNADCDKDLFSDDAVRLLFHASKGCPRALNQLALQTLINAAVDGRRDVDQRFVRAQIANHPLYQMQPGD